MFLLHFKGNVDVLVIIPWELRVLQVQECLCWGVAANKFLRKNFEIACSKADIQLFYPPIKLCTDNAAMIASSAYFSYIENEFAPLNLNAVPGLKLGEKHF